MPRAPPPHLALWRFTIGLQFVTATATPKCTDGRRNNGSNGLYKFVNDKVHELKTTRGATGVLSAFRLRVARRYRALDPVARRREQNSYLLQRSQNLPRPIDADNAPPGDNSLDIRSHFGMGSGRYPVGSDAWQTTLREYGNTRGGIRRLSDQTLPEASLIIKPIRKKLVLQPSSRSYCRRKHPGFCPADHGADVLFRYDAVLQHLKAHESPAGVGAVTLRFYEASADRRLANFTDDVIVSFANLRQQPRYRAVYLEGEARDPFRAEDFPFMVCDSVVQENAVPQIVETDGSRLTRSIRRIGYSVESLTRPRICKTIKQKSHNSFGKACCAFL